MGAFDAEGVWIYDETDARDTFSQLLNVGQDSVSAALASDRGRLAALEDLEWGGTVAGPLAAAAGWDFSVQNRGGKIGGLAFIEATATRTGAALGITASTGLLAAANTLGTFAAGWVPRGGQVFVASSHEGRLATIRVAASGVQLRAMGGTASIATGDTVAFTSVYPLA